MLTDYVNSITMMANSKIKKATHIGDQQIMTTKSKLKPLPKDLAEFRKNGGLSQGDFWSRYGVTQSGGSRYESGRNMSVPLKLLVRLHLSGVISDDQLMAARAK